MMPQLGKRLTQSYAQALNIRDTLQKISLQRTPTVDAIDRGLESLADKLARSMTGKSKGETDKGDTGKAEKAPRPARSDAAEVTTTMTAAPAIFDRALLRRRRARRDAGCDFLFQEAAERLFDRLGVVRKEFPRVLDLGCATGALSEMLRGRAGTEAVIAADTTASPGVSVVADPELLPFAPGSFDMIASCLDLQWVNDLPGALTQIRFALKPDGLFLGCLAGGETLKELRAALMEAELLVTGGASPRVSPFADLRDMGALMQRAGFALPVTDSDRITVDYENIFKLMHDLRGMGAAGAAFSRLKIPTRRAVFLEAARIYQEKFGDAQVRIPATFDIIYMIGWAPHASQQQALKPGSAKARLSDALKVEERSAGEKATF